VIIVQVATRPSGDPGFDESVDVVSNHQNEAIVKGVKSLEYRADRIELSSEMGISTGDG